MQRLSTFYRKEIHNIAQFRPKVSTKTKAFTSVFTGVFSKTDARDKRERKKRKRLKPPRSYCLCLSYLFCTMLGLGQSTGPTLGNDPLVHSWRTGPQMETESLQTNKYRLTPHHHPPRVLRLVMTFYIHPVLCMGLASVVGGELGAGDYYGQQSHIRREGTMEMMVILESGEAKTPKSTEDHGNLPRLEQVRKASWGKRCPQLRPKYEGTREDAHVWEIDRPVLVIWAAGDMARAASLEGSMPGME